MYRIITVFQAQLSTSFAQCTRYQSIHSLFWMPHLKCNQSINQSRPKGTRGDGAGRDGALAQGPFYENLAILVAKG
jgi:hypothetical protein